MLSVPYRKNAAVCKSRSKSSTDPDHSGTLVWNFPVSRAVRNKFLLFKPSNLWYFVKAAGTKTEVFKKEGNNQCKILQNWSTAMLEKCLFVSATLWRILTGKERWKKDHKVKLSLCVVRGLGGVGLWKMILAYFRWEKLWPSLSADNKKQK